MCLQIKVLVSFIYVASIMHIHHFQDKYPLLPKCRRLDSAEFADVSKVLETKPNIRILQRHINKVYGKKITLKDVRNISVKWKTSSNANDVETALSILSPNAGSVIELQATSQQSGYIFLYFSQEVVNLTLQ